jgi:uncharacterized protein (DUF952 family)
VAQTELLALAEKMAQAEVLVHLAQTAQVEQQDLAEKTAQVEALVHLAQTAQVEAQVRLVIAGQADLVVQAVETVFLRALIIISIYQKFTQLLFAQHFRLLQLQEASKLLLRV